MPHALLKIWSNPRAVLGPFRLPSRPGCSRRGSPRRVESAFASLTGRKRERPLQESQDTTGAAAPIPAPISIPEEPLLLVVPSTAVSGPTSELHLRRPRFFRGFRGTEVPSQTARRGGV